jgi:hypothetical protein
MSGTTKSGKLRRKHEPCGDGCAKKFSDCIKEIGSALLFIGSALLLCSPIALLIIILDPRSSLLCLERALSPLVTATISALIFCAYSLIFVFAKEVKEGYHRLNHLCKIEKFIDGNKIHINDEIRSSINNAKTSQHCMIDTYTRYRGLAVLIPIFLIAICFFLMLLSIATGLDWYPKIIESIWILLLGVSFFLPFFVGAYGMRQRSTKRYEEVRLKFLKIVEKENEDMACKIYRLLADNGKNEL